MKNPHMILESSGEYVWIGGIDVPRDILNLEIIAEQESFIPAGNFVQFLESEKHYRNLNAPEEANGYEPIPHQDGQGLRRGRGPDKIYGLPEVPGFVVRTRYFHFDERAYASFVDELSEEHQISAEVARHLTED